MTLEELQKVHPTHTGFKKDWLFYIRSYLGGRFYREGDYLLKHPLESEDNYKRRKETAYFYNYCAPVVDITTSYVYRKPPERDYGSLCTVPVPPRVPETLFDSFWGNCDYEGTSFEQFVRSALRYAGVYGRVYIAVDKPTEQTTSVADALARDVRPYVALITPENMLDWDMQRIEGRMSLTRAKIAEEWDTVAGTLVPVQVRVWTRFDWTVYRVVYVGDKAEVKIQSAGTHDLGEVPIVTLVNKRIHGIPGIGQSDLQDIADINKNIYYLCSDAKEIIENTAFPMLAVPQDSGASSGSEKETGPKSILQFDPTLTNAKPYWLEAPHSSLAEIRKWIEQDIAEIAYLAHLGGSRTSESSTQPWSGVALDLLMDQLKATLIEKADNGEQAEIDVLRLWAKWEGRKFDGDIKYNRDFALRDLTTSLTNAIAAVNAKVNSLVFAKELQKKIVASALPELDEVKRASIYAQIEENVNELTTGEAGRIYEYHLKVKGGLMSKNELRKTLGWGPLAQGGDEMAVEEVAGEDPAGDMKEDKTDAEMHGTAAQEK